MLTMDHSKRMHGRELVIDNDQGLSFAGVNAHHTNGLAERRIRSLQSLARSMLIEVHQCWDVKATASLWPYAIRMASDSLNNTPNLRDKMKRTPLQTFSNTECQPNKKHWAPFGWKKYLKYGVFRVKKWLKYGLRYLSFFSKMMKVWILFVLFPILA